MTDYMTENRIRRHQLLDALQPQPQTLAAAATRADATHRMADEVWYANAYGTVTSIIETLAEICTDTRTGPETQVFRIRARLADALAYMVALDPEIESADALPDPDAYAAQVQDFLADVHGDTPCLSCTCCSTVECAVYPCPIDGCACEQRRAIGRVGMPAAA